MDKPLTVAELIAQLQELPQDSVVRYFNENHKPGPFTQSPVDYFAEVTTVEAIPSTENDVASVNLM